MTVMTILSKQVKNVRIMYIKLVFSKNSNTLLDTTPTLT